MDELKKQFQKDFEQSHHVDISFDTTQLEANTHKTKHRIKPYKIALIVMTTLLVTFVAVPVSFVFIASLRTKESFKAYNKRYSLNEIKIAESNTFKKINNISYPTSDSPIVNRINDEEVAAYNNFSNLTYHSLVNSGKKDNMSYAIIGLYSIMNELNNAVSKEDLKVKFNNLLGLNETARISFYDKVMKANSFATDKATIQLKNAAFFHHEYNYNQAFVNSLSKLYCEVYQLNFVSEADKMVSWVNQAVNTKGYIDENYLDINDETHLFLFSTLYFKNAWSHKYLADDNIEDDFYLSDGNKVKTTYMRHSYLSANYYDYDTYISIKDWYYNGYASVTYLVPKKVEDNIFALTKSVNIFEEKEENKVEHEEYGAFKIYLKTPKFINKSDIDFKPCLQDLGLGEIFDREIDTLKGAFDDERLVDYNAYMQQIKQKNEVEFNEDGSIVKSLEMAKIGLAGSAGPMEHDTLEVDLNQPFIYIIKDINDTPIFVGHMDNPSK